MRAFIVEKFEEGGASGKVHKDESDSGADALHVSLNVGFRPLRFAPHRKCENFEYQIADVTIDCCVKTSSGCGYRSGTLTAILILLLLNTS